MAYTSFEEHYPYLSEGKNLLALLCSSLGFPKKVIEDYISVAKSDLKSIEIDSLLSYYFNDGEDTHFFKGSMVKNIYNDERRSRAKLSNSCGNA